MPDPSPIPQVKPKEALAFFRAKGLAKSFAWQDLLKAQHDYWFTVAKMLSRSLLEDVRDAIAEGIAEGTAPREIARGLKAKMLAAGWWGRQAQTDPLTGERKSVQLGSDRRVRVIVETNLRTSYAAGRYARQDRVKALLPVKVYRSRMDGRERVQHAAWHNTALPFDHPWWETHDPPCDWGCRCMTVTMTKGQAARRGLDWEMEPQTFPTRSWRNKRTGEVEEIEQGIGAGWDYSPGRAQIEGLAPPALHAFSLDDSQSLASVSGDASADFLAVFGLGAAGGVWRDVAGWPLALSQRWLRGLSKGAQLRARAAAAAIAEPDSIRLVWVLGKDGRGILMRRYVKRGPSGTLVVDLGGAGWRWLRTKVDVQMLETGIQIWPG